MNIIPPEMWLTLHNTDAERLASERRSLSPAHRRRPRAAVRPRLSRLRHFTLSKGQK